MPARRRRGDPEQARHFRGVGTVFAGIATAFAFVACSGDGGDSGRLPPPSDEWTYYGGQNSFNRYSPLTQIDPENVDAVQVLWRRPAVDGALTAEYPELDFNNYLRGTPVLVGGTLYAPNAVGLVEAFDPGTGETRWVQRPESEEDVRGRSFRGVAYWRGSGTGSGDGGADGGVGDSAGRIISVRGPSMHALDAATGEPIASFGDGGRVDLQLPAGGRYGWSSGPIVVGDVIVLAGTVDGA
ncbi:MAG: PQQ-binding-like beta-propeller repeat protein, partial [Gemmatimonadales bacterium]|nr:PQQ-binding-like beta-propeller repeat protein [Gemmatimonadales bacterium]